MRKDGIEMKMVWIGLLVCLLVSPAFATVQWRDGTGAESPLGSINPGTIDDAIYDNITAPLDNLLAEGRFGCKLTYASASTLTVGIGSIVVSNSAGTIRLMGRNSSATTVTWSNIDTSTEETSTTYYVHAVLSAVSDTTFVIKISKSATAPTGVTYFKKLGSFLNDASGNITDIVDDSAIAVAPSGSIQMFGAATAPSGWLICDGSAVSRTTYATLFNVISTTFGVGNGSTTFNLPDMTNRFPYGSSTGTDAGNADVGSAADRTLTGNDSSITLLTTPVAMAPAGSSNSASVSENMMAPYLSLFFIIKT